MILFTQKDIITNLMLNRTQNFCRYPTLVARRKKTFLYFCTKLKIYLMVLFTQKDIITNLFVAKNITIISCNHKNHKRG